MHVASLPASSALRRAATWNATLPSSTITPGQTVARISALLIMLGARETSSASRSSGNANYLPSSNKVGLTITKAPTVTTAAFAPGGFVYSGSAVSATASVSPTVAGTPTISYSGDCVNAGTTCKATATFAETGNFQSSTGIATTTIAKAPTTTSVTFGPGPFIYTGSAFTATAAVTPGSAGTATIAYAGDCINAGNTSHATATFGGASNFLPSSASTSNILIKLPVATSAERCKNGGWKFTTDDLGNLFKNQGDCVSYVASKGKNMGDGGN
jgi:hypothetical protein